MPVARKILRFIIILALLLLIFIAQQPAHAYDAAPPEPPPGVNLLPDEVLTNVQMLYEEVIIEVDGPATYEDPYFSISGTGVNITATFVFKNQSKEEERLSVLFPFTYKDGWGNQRSVENFKVTINDRPLDWQVIPIPEKEWENNYEVWTAWAGWGMTFPAKKEITVQVRYSILAINQYSGPGVHIGYILETGAGWYGAILGGDIILRLPHEANRLTVLEYGTSPGGKMVGNEVRWHFENLEPTAADNWQAVVLPPGVWEKLTTAQAAIADDPGNAKALSALVDATLAAVLNPKRDFLDHSNHAPQVNLLLETERALARGVLENPNDIELRFAYLEIMYAHLNNYVWGVANFPSSYPYPLPENVVAQLNAIHRLDPSLVLIEDYDRFDFLYYELDVDMPPIEAFYTPTVTLGPSPTLGPTNTPWPTNTPAPTWTPKPTKTASPPAMTTEAEAPPATATAVAEQTSPPGPCNNAYLPLVAVGFMFVTYRKRKFRSAENSL